MAKGIPLPVTVTNLDTEIGNAVKKVGTINIPVSVDPTAFKKLAQPLGRVSGLATEFEKSIAASNARVLAFGASVGIINGVQNAFASLLQTGIEVQKTLAEIAAISGQSGEALAKFGDSLFEIGKLTGQSFKTAAQAALEFSRQGLSTEETLKRTTDALTLTRFTTLNAAEAVDVLTAAANSFGDTGITTTEILNKLVAVDTKFAVSAEDLANGLARAGSIAQEVGVSFDELNAAITVAQERTARGGSVIGNALKTIFTRLRSDETVQALRSIGVESLNAQGGLKGAIPLLEEVAQKLEGLSEGERVQILEAIASKYNINILSAILTDLSDANKKFGEIVGISASAGNQAYERQIELNKILDAQINITTLSVQQLFNKLAEIGVTESLTNLLKFVNGLLDGINKILDSESTGGNIAKGLIKGISEIFFTVGLPLLGAIFVKLTKDIAQFGVESLKTILGINQQVRERQALEQAVVNTLIRDQEIMATILSLSGNRAKQEEYLLSVYNRQLAALQQVQSIAAGVAPALQAAGLSATSGTVKRRAAEGYLPAAEAKDVRRGVGGASPSSKVVEIPNFSFGGGKRGTMVANTSEYIVPNYGGGSGTAIFNQDMAKEYGLPPGAKKITASGGFVPASGFVPNFAAKKFNVFDQARAKVKKDQEPIDYVDLDGMRRSAYLTLDASIDPVGRFSKLQSSAQQKLTEKLGPIAENAKIVPEQGSIEFVQINKSLQRDDLVQKIRETKNKIQANPKAKIDKDIEDIIQSILPETKGSVDNNLKAAVKAELQVQGPAVFRSGNVLEDILFKKITGTIEGRNSKTWDLPAEQSGAFKSRFGFKSEFGDIKLGSSTSSISSFIGKHIISPTGQNASGGYIPNFARYVYDADRVDADKNNLLKAILASRVKKNLIVGPAGSGKSTYGESLGSFITNIAQLTDASEIDILSGAARTKDGGVSKNFQQISDAVNASGGKISYLYTGNMDILSRRTGRIAEGPKQGDLRSKKQIVGTMFAPLNQFDFISKVKGSAKNFEMIRGAKGYVPNFADKKPATIKGGKVDRKTYTGPRALVSAQGIAGMIVPDQDNQETMNNYLKENPWGFQTKEDVYLPPENSLITNVKYNTYGLNEKAFEGQALKKSGTQTLIEADVEKAGIEIAKKWATKYSDEYAKKMPGRSVKTNYDENFIRTSFTASEGAVSAISTLGGGIFESSIRAALDTQVGQRIEKAQKEDSNNRLDFPVNPFLKELFGIEGGEQFVDAKISGSPGSTGRKLADQIVAAGLYKTERIINTKTAAQGYVPNFAEIKKQQELLAPSGQFYDLDTADKFLAASNISVENQPSAPKGLGDNLKRRILEAAQKVYGPNAKIGVSRLPGKREAFTSAVLKNPALADDFIALQMATTGGVGPIANTQEALAKFNNPTPFDPGPPPAVRAVGGKSRAVKKVGPMSLNAIEGYIPNFADLFVDYDYTIFGQQLGKATDFNAQKALIKNIPEDQMTEQERQARDAQMKLLTPFGQKLLQSKKPFKLATARWSDYQPGIESSLRGLGFNVNGVFALGREFSEEQYKVDNPKFAEEMKKPEGERNTRVKPRIEPSAAQKKALFFKERAPQIATGDIDFVDNDAANLQAVKSLMPKINTFTPDQYMAKLLAPQQVKGTKASLGYIPNFASQNALDAMRRIIADPAAPQGEKDAAASKLAQLSKVTSSGNPRVAAQKIVKTKLPITQEDKDYLNQNKEKIVAGMGRSFGMLFNLDALEIGDLNYVKRLDPSIAKKLSEIVQKQGGRDSVRSLIDFGSAARGYIPNFAENEPLKEAIDREVAAGIPPARVRVTQDDRLQNSKNPQGLAVINTRDEPNGKIPNNFRKRAAIQEVASRGFVPNFADLSKQQIEEIFGKSKRRKNTEVYTGGKDFDYGVKDDKKPSKQLETNTNKLIASFVGLQLATSTLQSTFKDSESAIGKTLTTISQIGSSAVGYGSLGSLLGDTLKDKGGLTGQVGKIAGQAGLLVGTVLGTITAISDILDEQREALEKKRKSAGQSDITNILNQNTGLSEETQREALAKRRKEIEFELSQRQRSIDTAPDIRYVGSPNGVSIDYTGKGTKESDLEKVKDLQNQINNFKAKEFELTTAILNANIRQSQQREQALKKEREELGSRISLEKVRISLSEAFAANELSFEKERNNRQLEYIKNEVFLSELQKNILRDREELIKVQEKEFQLNASAVKSILEKVKASGELTSVDVVRVGSLENELKFGKRITDVRQAINELGLKGVSNLELIVLTELSNLKVAQDKREEEQRFLVVKQKNVAQSQALLNIERSISQAISSREQANRQAFDDSFNYDIDSNLVENQKELLELRQQIASQPFATPEQEAQLGRLTLSTEQYSNVLRANAELVKQRNSIFRNTQKDFIAAFSDTGQLNFLPPQIREGFAKDLLDTVDLTELEDALTISINTIRDTLSEEIDLSSLNPEEATALMESYKNAISDAYGSLIEKGLIANQQLEIAEKRRNIAISQVRTLADFEQKIKEIREKSPATAGLYRAFVDLNNEARGFTEKFSYDATFAFRDGLRDALGAAISQTDDLNGALQGVAVNFLKTLQNAFLNQATNNVLLSLGNSFPKVFGNLNQNTTPPGRAKGGYIKGYADGGKVVGGSGIRDDVPAMLSAGEYVIRKSSVQKYGENNLKKLNSGEAPKFANGGFFLPGIRGGTEISGYKDLTAFAKQTTTSGATDVLKGGQSSAFINLEDQSQKLSAYALMNEDDIVNKEIRSAQQQGINLIKEREAYRTAQRKAFQKQLVGLGLSMLASYGASKLPTGKPGVPDLGKASVPNVPQGNVSVGPLTTVGFRGAYGGLIRRYNTGGGPTDDIPALLMAGEYVMSRQATKKYGKQFFDSVNQGRAPRFAGGGQVPTSESSFAEKAADSSESKAKSGANVNITINVTKGSSTTESQGSTEETDADYKKMSEQIKAIVMNTINEEKRLGGSLRPRG